MEIFLEALVKVMKKAQFKIFMQVNVHKVESN